MSADMQAVDSCWPFSQENFQRVLLKWCMGLPLLTVPESNSLFLEERDMALCPSYKIFSALTVVSKSGQPSGVSEAALIAVPFIPKTFRRNVTR